MVISETVAVVVPR